MQVCYRYGLYPPPSRQRALARALGYTLPGHGRRLVVLDDGDAAGALVRDMAGVLAWFCGRRPARDRALKAVGCARRDIGPQALLEGERATTASGGR